MKFLCYVERLNRMNQLLKSRTTGTPSEFARYIGVSRTRLYEMIDEMRSYGAPISYSKAAKTFYYEQPYDISVSIIVNQSDEK